MRRRALGSFPPVPSVALLVACLLALASGTASAPPAVAAAAADDGGPSWDGTRQPAVAGQFYPGDADRLERAVRGFLADARRVEGTRPLAIVAPHAGYIYSGQIAADAWRQAQGHDYDVIVILGTNHTRAGFGKVSVYAGRGYRTPLGLARIDRELAGALLASDGDVVCEPAVHASEHSVEVQVPFAQALFPDVPIVAAVVGRPDPDLCRRFGERLAAALVGRRALIVASSDLAHYPGHEDAVRADGAVLRAVASLDPEAVRRAADEGLREGRPGLSTCACGEGAILAAMWAARGLGARRGVVVSHATSGDALVGDPGRVVGYGAVALCAGEAGADVSALDRPPVPAWRGELNPADREALLALARETIARYCETETTPLVRDLPPALERHQGAFVTLKRHGELRGCIGHMAEDRPLCQAVGAMALQAAFNDRRFPPLRCEELPGIEIEISVLTPFERVRGPEAIVIGRDGVVLRKDGRSAVFLPQVATEQGWDRETMLEHLCRKAGLAPDAWRRGAELSTFRAEVFHEGDVR